MDPEEFERLKKLEDRMLQMLKEVSLEDLARSERAKLIDVNDSRSSEWVVVGTAFAFRDPINGRDEPVPYESPLEAGDLVDDVLEAEVVGLIAPQPQDRLDVERHVENCMACAQNAGRWKLCAHCLEMNVCSDVPTQLRQAPITEDQPEPLTYFARLPLCRECKRDAHNTRGLVLEE